jgi:Rad3-related DNA helicase
LLVVPVTLPCGYNVCKRHLDEQLDSTPKKIRKFECEVCDEKHNIPDKGFAINKSIQNALNIKLNTLKLNPVYEKCKREINDAENNIKNIENLEKDTENYIFEYFEELKRQVDLRREELKLKLENSSDQIIESIESHKENCIRLNKESKRLSTAIEKSKKELTKLIERFDTFEINDTKFNEIVQSLYVLNGGLTSKLGEYKESMIGGKEYTFEFKEIDIKGLFGCFKEVKKVILLFHLSFIFVFFLNYIF